MKENSKINSRQNFLTYWARKKEIGFKNYLAVGFLGCIAVFFLAEAVVCYILDRTSINLVEIIVFSVLSILLPIGLWYYNEGRYKRLMSDFEAGQEVVAHAEPVQNNVIDEEIVTILEEDENIVEELDIIENLDEKIEEQSETETEEVSDLELVETGGELEEESSEGANENLNQELEEALENVFTEQDKDDIIEQEEVQENLV